MRSSTPSFEKTWRERLDPFAQGGLGLVGMLAAPPGYAGCELLAVSNWLLDRDDPVGCIFFGSVDHLEGR